LDHNDIQDEGIRKLAEGLSMNSFLNVLSLSYCNITEIGARSLLEILIYCNCELKEIDL